MNATFLNLVIGLTFVILCACNAQAGMLEETCSLVYKKLSSGPYESLTKSIESFTDDGKSYHGCVIRFSGNANKVIDTQRPDGLFGNFLPYCPEGKLPTDLPRDLINEDGWCADKMADGPDGTSYRALKKNVFCAVEGHWDGGEDSNPNYAPSPRYEVIVKCANR
jgi:hypothetical protein